MSLFPPDRSTHDPRYLLVLYGGARDGEELSAIEVMTEVRVPYVADAGHETEHLLYRHSACTRLCRPGTRRHAYAFVRSVSV